MENSSTQILTPDQRLRVFVSSTLQELAQERDAVKTAIQNIHLTPVMFELGARAHDPRNLYRQYLAQSQIFVGIYWDRYGWVAPGETISGLEDEYNLSCEMPRLIYIKKSAGNREERLSQLIDRIKADDKVSYKTFSTAEELTYLIMNDLAILLTERFNHSARNETGTTETKSFNNIPAIPNSLIGREKNIEEIIALLNTPEHRLLTLTGPGGIGKTRLAIETAKRLQPQYADGVAYVPLAPVRDHNLVVETICYTLGMKVSGGNLLESLKLHLQEKKLLLVLDNFEQIIDAASFLDDLLEASRGLKILVTSRERLSLTFETLYTVPVLPDMFQDSIRLINEKNPPAIELFVQRAKAIQPSFDINDNNRDIIFKICHRLEGLPLAIELAAGQINLFSPALLLQKLDHQLDVLKVNFRDIPERQKTIRNAIDWSFELLSASEQSLLLHISLYNGGCLLHTIETIGADLGDVYSLITSLINKSLLSKSEEGIHVRFQMLESVREFALEKLEERDLTMAYKQVQADYYHVALPMIKLHKDKIDQSELLRCLEKEHANIRLALDFLFRQKDVYKITGIAWNLWLFWWVNAHTKEGYTWLKKAWELQKENPEKLDEHTFTILLCNVGFMSFLQRDLNLFNETINQHFKLIMKQDDDELIATTSLVAGVVKTIMKDYTGAEQILLGGLKRFKKMGMTTGMSLILSALGRNAIYQGGRIAKAKEYYLESRSLAKADKNDIAEIICLTGFALAEVLEKNTEAKNYLRETITKSRSIHFYEALAWSMEIWSLASINDNRMIHAVTLMGAVDKLRRVTELPVWEDLQAVILKAKDQIEAQMPAVVFNQAWNAGAAMTLDEMMAFTVMEPAEEINSAESSMVSAA